MGVLPVVHHQGVATALIRQLLANAEEEGVAAISLGVEADNGARNLYLKLGFRRIDEQADAWTMVCDVGGPRLNLVRGRFGQQ